MAIQILEQLFDSPIRVKLLKLFLRNLDKYFSIKEAAAWIRFNFRLTKKEIESLHSIGFLRMKKIKNRTSQAQVKGKRGRRSELKLGFYYAANSHFEFFKELATLVLKSSPASKERLLNNIQKLGRIKLALIAGVFLNSANSRVDILLIGDKINKKKLEILLNNLESEVGKEISYATLTPKEFYYRHNMFDRFLVDVLEKPHEKLINKLKI